MQPPESDTFFMFLTLEKGVSKTAIGNGGAALLHMARQGLTSVSTTIRVRQSAIIDSGVSVCM